MKRIQKGKICLVAIAAGVSFSAVAFVPDGDYVSDGLVAHWDAIDNVATGVHDPTAAKWVDKVGGVALNGEFVVGEKTVAPSADVACVFTGLNDLEGYTVETLSYRTVVSGSGDSGFIATPRININYKLGGGAKTLSVWLVSNDAYGNHRSWGRYYLGNDEAKQREVATRTVSYAIGASRAEGQPSFYYEGAETPASANEGWTGLTSLNDDVKIFSGTTYHSVRIYNRVLSAEEVAYNYAVDQKRFFGNTGPISKYSRFEVLPIPAQMHTGKEIVPEVQVLLKNGEERIPLTKGEDYVIACENNIEIGTASVTITGAGAYRDEIPAYSSFEIVKAFEIKIAEGPTVSWVEPYAQPKIAFRLGGNGDYSANVTVSISTNGTDWCYVSGLLSGLTNGQESTVVIPKYYLAGDYLTAKVSAESRGANASAVCNPVEIVGELPPWSEKGGNPKYVIHVRAGATGLGDGTSWTDALTDLADALDALTDERYEIWWAGDRMIDAASRELNFTFTTPLVLRGGFTGAEDAPEERTLGARSTIDGQMADVSGLLAYSTKPITIDSVAFLRCGSKGVYCETRATGADVLLTNCTVRCCGSESLWGGSYQAPISVGGGGATFYCKSGVSSVRLVDCDLSGQVSAGKIDVGSGGGAYFKGFQCAYLERCTVMTNSCNAWRSAQAIGLQFTDQPVIATNCRFAGNRASVSGMAVQLYGKCSGSEFRNCQFSGNVDSGANGVLCANLSSSEDTLLVENCTFAYNLVPNCSALRVNTGTATVKNSIFFGNVKLGTSANGADIACGAGGSVSAGWSFFGGKGVNYTTGAVTVAPNCVTTGDPLFVTTVEAFKALTGVSDVPVGSGAFSDFGPSAALDVHLLSSAGYRTDGDSEWHKAEDTVSTAIDAGDPDGDCSLEPPDNGGCVNMGAYGNTPEASKTPSSRLDIDGVVTVVFEGDYTQPTVRFKMGGEGAYSAEAVISVYVDGAATPAFVSEVRKGLVRGQNVNYRVPTYFTPGAKLVVNVMLSAGGKEASASSEETEAKGVKPPWDGKGGGANVIHVRSGATGRGDGSSWTDAYENLHEALKSLSAGKDEVWISGTNVLSESSPDFGLATSLAIRGGFNATECTFAERKAGARSRVDGCDTYNCLTFHDAAGVTVTLDGIEFVHGGSHGLRKTSGDGDLLVTNCSFVACGAANENNKQSESDGSGGSGVGLVGGGTAAFAGCDILGNTLDASSGHDGCIGVGLSACGLKRLCMDSCNVISNVNPHWRSGGGQGVYCYNTPVKIVNVRFAANDASCSAASVLWLNGSCSNSVVRNCAFVGNATGGTSMGLMRVSMDSPSGTVTIENNTFAYNFDSSSDASPTNCALHLVKGVASIRNCIFWDNLVPEQTEIGADIHVEADARAKITFTLFGGDAETYVTTVDPSLLTLKDCVFGDARLVTDSASFCKGARVSGEVPKVVWTTPCGEVRSAYNLHLRGGSGFYDEATDEKVTACRRKGNSPAIDAGDPAVKCVEPQPNGNRVNLGVYGNTPWATMSPGGLVLFVQ